MIAAEKVAVAQKLASAAAIREQYVVQVGISLYEDLREALLRKFPEPWLHLPQPINWKSLLDATELQAALKARNKTYYDNEEESIQSFLQYLLAARSPVVNLPRVYMVVDSTSNKSDVVCVHWMIPVAKIPLSEEMQCVHFVCDVPLMALEFYFHKREDIRMALQDYRNTIIADAKYRIDVSDQNAKMFAMQSTGRCLDGEGYDDDDDEDAYRQSQM